MSKKEGVDAADSRAKSDKRLWVDAEVEATGVLFIDCRPESGGGAIDPAPSPPPAAEDDSVMLASVLLLA